MIVEPIRAVDLKNGRRRYRVKTDGAPGPDGRRRQVIATFDRLTDARKYLARTRSEVTSGAYVPRSERTLEDYLTTWLQTRRHAVRPKTLEGYRVALQPAIRAFGAKPLDKVTKQDIAALVDDMVEAGKLHERSTSPSVYSDKRSPWP